MVFEFSNDIVPILFVFTVYLSFVAVHLANSIVKEYGIHHRLKSQRDMQLALHLSVTGNDAAKKSLQQRSFLTRIVKRKEAPEDDGDYHFSSNQILIINRGGQQWQKNLYSYSLKNIVSSSF